MGSFLNPIGPLPPAVYWRRRIFVFGVPLCVIALFAYSCSGSANIPVSQLTSPTSSAAPTETTAIITPGPVPTGSVQAQPAYPGVGPTGTAVGSGAGTGLGGSGGNGTGQGSSGCVLSAVVHLDKSGQNGPPVYQGGQDVYVSVVIHNSGSANCRFDVSGKGSVITVTPVGSTDAVWSSAACAAAADLRVLGPGEGFTETVRWLRQRAVGTCPPSASTVGVGSYQVTAAIDGVTAASVQFVLQ